jgi:hypothetical protein
MRYVLGVHLAPLGESTALAVLQLSERVTCWSEYDEQLSVEAALLTGARSHPFHRGAVRRRERCQDVVHLERLPVELGYKGIAAALADRVRAGSPLCGAAVVADVTAVGRAALDELDAAALRPVAVTIAAGDGDAPGTVAVLDLVTLLGLLLQEHRLRIAAGLALAPVLAAELAAAGAGFGPLAAALGVACWRGERVTDPQDWRPVHAS